MRFFSRLENTTKRCGQPRVNWEKTGTCDEMNRILTENVYDIKENNFSVNNKANK
jgi:hypothetical protein